MEVHAHLEERNAVAIETADEVPVQGRDYGSQNRELLEFILDVLDRHKAENVVEIDLHGKSEIADFMVVASGRSRRQVLSLSDKLLEAFKGQTFDITAQVEGRRQGDWVLIDAGDVIIHLFRPEVREFYQIEKMWMPSVMDSNTN